MDSGIESTESSNGSISDSCMNMGDIQVEESSKSSNASTNNVVSTMEEAVLEGPENFPQEHAFREPCSVPNLKLKQKKNKMNLDSSNFTKGSNDKSEHDKINLPITSDIILPPYLSSQDNLSKTKTNTLSLNSSKENVNEVKLDKPSNVEPDMSESEKNPDNPLEVPRPFLPKPGHEFQMTDLPVPEGCCLKLNFPKIETEPCGPQEQVTPFDNFPNFSFANGPLKIACNPQPYTGSLAVLPYESRELQRKFKHYRRRLKQIISTKPKEKKLRMASSLNNSELVEKLLQEGVNARATDEKQRTALHIAASKGYTNIVRLLLQNGADPNQKDSIGNTALHLAACTSHVETVTLLLKAGTDVKQADNQGYSPLHLANSRLKLLQKDINPSSHELRLQVYQIVEMMQEYLKSSGNTEEAELLSAWTTKLSLSDSSSQAESDIKQLLTSLQDLTLSKTKKE